MKVACTIVLILASGAREVRHAEIGYVVKEGHKSYQERLFVEFPELPQSPQVRWVDENACMYVEASKAETEQRQAVLELAAAEQRVDRAKWAAFHRWLLKSATKP